MEYDARGQQAAASALLYVFPGSTAYLLRQLIALFSISIVSMSRPLGRG
jgi:hypothetical protein